MTASTATHVVKVKGSPIELGGTVRIVPPLSLGSLEQLKDALSNFTGNVSETEQVSTVITAAHAALKRNYPDITREEVGEAIGLENMLEVMEAVMDVSGMKRKAAEAVPGEAKPE